MTDLRAELRRKWQEAYATKRAGFEWRGMALDVNAAVKFLAAVREPDERRAVILEAPLSAAPATPYRFAGDGLSVMDQRRSSEGIFRLAIVLEQDAVSQVFEVLAADVVEVATPASNPAAAIAETVRRLEIWRACLKSRRLGLSIESQVGLIGELMVLDRVAAALGYAAAVEAWQGPLDGIHDFVAAGVAVEVKTALGVGNQLRISRLAQLDTAGISMLAVARPRLQESEQGAPLPVWVTQMREAISANELSAVPAFHERITRAGYLEVDEPMYAGLRFALHDLQWYRVSAGFPRLVPSTVPAGIVDGTYMIDERALPSFRLGQPEVDEIILSMRKSSHA